MKILLIDNYDSFTYNLYHYTSSLNFKVDVVRNDKIEFKKINSKKYKKIIISPGPGRPEDAGMCINVVKKYYKTIPILGVCLGHQIIARAFDSNTYKLKFGHRGGNQPVKYVGFPTEFYVQKDALREVSPLPVLG